ncbi:MAG: 4-(cytidine 5'-diphospho)-2-C-methyl-D-erythritol kinase [Xanthobacteraceae bacterium]
MAGKDVDARHKAGHDDSLVEHAPAKINLTLRVLGRRADGYHDIESLVVFARTGDRLTFAPGGALQLELCGPYGAATGALGDNLVLKAARALAASVEGLGLGRFVLDKQLPVAAGLGGGSADAAAALRLLARANALAPDDPRLFAAARSAGADVPVCLEARPRIMRGIGDRLAEPLDLPVLAAVLVNPGVAVATKDVFAGLGLSPGETRGGETATIIPMGRHALFSFLADHPNDLEAAAISLKPIIADVLVQLRALPECRFSRMSGSGATCFALFDTARAASAAARALKAAHPDWWVVGTDLG